MGSPANVKSQDVRRFGPRSHNHLVLGLVTALLAIVVGVMNGFGSFGAAWIVLALPIWFIVDDIITAIRISPEAVRVTTAMGWPVRTLRFRDIDRVALGKARAGPQGAPRVVVAFDLLPNRGRPLRLVPDQFAGFDGYGGWAARLKAGLEAHQVQMDRSVTEALAAAISR